MTRLLIVAVLTVLALVVPLVVSFVLADLAVPVTGARCVAPHHPSLCPT